MNYVKAMKQALTALENSVDLVINEYTEAVNLYGKYPTRVKRIEGLADLLNDHKEAIDTLRQAIEQAEQEHNLIPSNPGELERAIAERDATQGRACDLPKTQAKLLHENKIRQNEIDKLKAAAALALKELITANSVSDMVGEFDHAIYRLKEAL